MKYKVIYISEEDIPVSGDMKFYRAEVVKKLVKAGKELARAVKDSHEEYDGLGEQTMFDCEKEWQSVLDKLE